MRKRVALMAAVFLLGALSATAQAPCTNGDDLARLFAPAPDSAEAPADLAWLFEPAPQPAVAAYPATAGAIALASTARKPGGEIEATCTVTEDCNELADISCSGTTCQAVSRDCSPWSCERGWVKCNGVTTY